ncbi:MAG: transferase hexapeptide repeat family protein [Alphaproteobacteria bacterium]
MQGRGNVFSFDGVVPVVDPDAFVHPAATLIGDVVVGARCFVGPGAVLRGDLGRLVLMPGSNVQDTCVLHSFPGADVVVEEDGHVGHGAVLHGCTVRRNAMIGINAVVLDGAEIGEEAIVGAAALVPTGFKVPPRTLAAGIPARVVRPLTDADIARKTAGTRIYQDLAARSLRTLLRCEPLAAAESGRRRVPPPFGGAAAG